MNITFLIGNGFDLNLGLKTGYKDFKKYYYSKNPTDKLSLLLKDEIIDYWSDLESSLGKTLEQYSENEIDDFLDSKESMEKCFQEYLSHENSRFHINSPEELFKIFSDNVTNFYSEFNSTERQQYKSFLSNTTEKIHYSFITYNYTYTLDEIIKCCSTSNCFGQHTASSFTYHDVVDEPLHIHGDLETGIIFGVDNASQLCLSDLVENRYFEKYLIKERLNNDCGEQRVSKAKQIIDASKYVCLYGLSAGITDGMWWKYLIEWLSKADSRRLVLFVHDENTHKFSTSAQNRNNDILRQIFISRGFKDKVAESVSNRIIIVEGSGIFNLKGFSVSEHDEEKTLQFAAT